MYSVSVRDHLMIAHSFRGEAFGPAQALHGATFVVDAEFRAAALDADGVVVDIGRAGAVLRELVAQLNYRNLDDLPQFQGCNTTTEFLAHHLHQGMAAAIREGRLGPSAAGVRVLKMTLHESHVAWAAYEGELERAP